MHTVFCRGEYDNVTNQIGPLEMEGLEYVNCMQDLKNSAIDKSRLVITEDDIKYLTRCDWLLFQNLRFKNILRIVSQSMDEFYYDVFLFPVVELHEVRIRRPQFREQCTQHGSASEIWQRMMLGLRLS